jgi:hypothetical protein
MAFRLFIRNPCNACTILDQLSLRLGAVHSFAFGKPGKGPAHLDGQSISGPFPACLPGVAQNRELHPLRLLSQRRRPKVVTIAGLKIGYRRLGRAANLR